MVLQILLVQNSKLHYYCNLFTKVTRVSCYVHSSVSFTPPDASCLSESKSVQQSGRDAPAETNQEDIALLVSGHCLSICAINE